MHARGAEHLYWLISLFSSLRRCSQIAGREQGTWGLAAYSNITVLDSCVCLREVELPRFGTAVAVGLLLFAFALPPEGAASWLQLA